MVVLDEMPTTAIGKIFKPQLSCYQVESVIQAALAEIDMMVKVNASPSKQHGILASIEVNTEIANVQSQVDEALANFALHYQLKQVQANTQQVA
mgnify:CR=1 FL=1